MNDADLMTSVEVVVPLSRHILCLGLGLALAALVARAFREGRLHVRLLLGTGGVLFIGNLAGQAPIALTLPLYAHEFVGFILPAFFVAIPPALLSMSIAGRISQAAASEPTSRPRSETRTPGSGASGQAPPATHQEGDVA